MKPKVLKIIEIIFTVIMVSIIGIMLLFIAQRLIYKDKPAKLFGVYAFEVISDSMYKEGDPDCIKKGDLVIVKKNKVYEIGMVISYQKENETIPTTHKITNIDGSTITTKGINDLSGGDSEESFDEKYVLGEVKFVIKNFARTKEILLSPYTLIGVFGITIGGFVLLYVFGKEDKKEEQPKIEEK